MHVYSQQYPPVPTVASSHDLRQPQSALLSLPVEIHNKIFSYLDQSTVDLETLTSVPCEQAPLRSLLMTCRQMFLDLENYPINIIDHMQHFLHQDTRICFTALTTVRWTVPSALGCMVDEFNKTVIRS